MFDFLPKLIRSPIFFGILILIVIMFPSVIYKQAESDNIAVTVMVGLDKLEDNPEDKQFELSIMFITPQSSSSLDKNYALVSSTGANVSECITDIQTKIGKQVGFPHCQVIIISETIAKDNALKYLDSFIRTNDLTTNAMLIASENPKKLLEAHIDESNTLSLSLMDILTYNSTNIFTADMNLEKFYMEYLDESSTSFMPVINVKEKPSSEGSSSGSGSGSGSTDSNEGSSNTASENTSSNNSGENSDSYLSTSSMGETKAEIEFDGTTAIFFRGKMIDKLNREQSEIYNILSSKVENNSIQLKGIETEYTGKANFTCRIKGKEIMYNYNFVNGYPVCQVDLNLECKLVEINADENYTLDSVSLVNSQLSDNLKDAIKIQVTERFADAINYAKANDIDMFSLRKKFGRLCYKEWREYMLNVDADSNFMQDIIFILNLNVVDES